MNVPVWAYVLSILFILIGSLAGSYVLLKNTGRTTQSAEEIALSVGQREFIKTLQTSAKNYEDILSKFAEEVKAKIEAQREAAETKAKLSIIESKVNDIEAKMATLLTEREDLIKQSACVPVLESQIAEKDRVIAAKDATIKEMGVKIDTYRAMAETAGRAQERLEGAVLGAEKAAVDFMQAREGGEGR